MKVTVESDKCVASGQCVLLAPEVFDQDDDGIIVLLTDTPADDDRQPVRDAVRVCPAAVITARE
jgi:ferredoxin